MKNPVRGVYQASGGILIIGSGVFLDANCVANLIM
jgi:hypothetical protein